MPNRLLTGVLVFALCLMVLQILVAGRSLLVPLAVAVLIWFVINGLARGFGWITGGILPDGVYLVASMLIIAGILTMAVELIADNISAMADKAPAYQRNVTAQFESFIKYLGMPIPENAGFMKDWNFSGILGNVARTIADLVGNAGLISIYVIFLLVEQQFFDSKIRAIFPNTERRETVQQMLLEIRSRTQTYLSIRCVLALATSMATYFVLTWVGVDFASFWAFLAFLMNFIPVVGAVAAVALPALLALVQFPTLTPFIIVAVGLSGAQIVINNLIEPRVLGQSLNLSPLVVIFSLMLWGQIWGVAGMFLSIPLMVIILNILAEFPATRSVAAALSMRGHV